MRARSILVVTTASLGVAAGLAAAIVPGRSLQATGMGLLGLAGAFLAINGMVDRQLLVVTHVARFAQYEDRAALWAGVPILLLGSAIAVAGVTWGAHAESRVLALIAARPGLVLLPFGIGTASGGVASFLGFRLTRHPDRLLVRARIGGPLTVTWGLLLVALGLFELAAPAAFDAATDAAASWFVGTLGSPGG